MSEMANGYAESSLLPIVNLWWWIDEKIYIVEWLGGWG